MKLGDQCLARGQCVLSDSCYYYYYHHLSVEDMLKRKANGAEVGVWLLVGS